MATDRELLERFIAGEEPAFAEVLARHGGMVHGACRRILGNADEADDAAQAVFLALALEARRLRHHAALGGWLHRVAWHVSLRMREARDTRRRHEAAAGTALAVAPPAEDDGLAAATAALDQELVALPDHLRLPLLLHHGEGKTFAEIAALLGCRDSAVSMRLTRGRERLRERLLKRGIALSPVAIGALLQPTSALPTHAATALARAATSLGHGRGAAEAVGLAGARAALRALMIERLRALAPLAAAAAMIVATAGALLVTSSPSMASAAEEPRPLPPARPRPTPVAAPPPTIVPPPSAPPADAAPPAPSPEPTPSTPVEPPQPEVHAAEAAPAELPPEPAVIEGIRRPVTVTATKELTIPTPRIPDLARTELYFRVHDGKAWGAWQKHGIVFDAGAPIVWAPPEGVVQVYLRPTLTSGLSAEAPTGDPPRPELSLIRVVDRTPPEVALRFPENREKLRGGERYTITWTATDAYLRSAPVTLRWSRDGSTWQVLAAGIPNTGRYEWTTPVDMTVAGQLRIDVADKASNVGVAASRAILIDSIKPSGRVVGPAIASHLAIPLQLDIQDGGPAGLRSAQLWVSADDGLTWVEGPWIKNPKNVEWTAPGDGRYRLSVLPVDQAGNRAPVPKGKSGDQFELTVDTTPPQVRLNAAIGIAPAGGAPAGNGRAFKPGDRVQVAFVVTDADAAPNSAAVYLETAPEKWTEIARGQPLDQVFRFEIPAIAAKAARIKVAAADQAGNVGEAVSAESFEIQTTIEVTHSIDEGDK